MQLSEDRAIVGDNSLYQVAMSALVCTTRLWVGEGSVTASYAAAYTVSSMKLLMGLNLREP